MELSCGIVDCSGALGTGDCAFRRDLPTELRPREAGRADYNNLVRRFPTPQHTNEHISHAAHLRFMGPDIGKLIAIFMC